VTEVFEKQFQIARRSMVDLLNAYAELSSVEAAAAQAESERQAFALEYLHATATTQAGVNGSRAVPLDVPTEYVEPRLAGAAPSAAPLIAPASSAAPPSPTPPVPTPPSPMPPTPAADERPQAAPAVQLRSADTLGTLP
jgi:hypothetical protein